MNPGFASTIFQNAWVVDDLEAACHDWSTHFGVGPFFIIDYQPSAFEAIDYRGTPSELSMRVALAQAGPLQIELVEPRTLKSVYRESVPIGSGSGFHHMCKWSDEFEDELTYFQGLGYDIVTRGRTRSTVFAYLDTRASLGCMLEIVPRTPKVEAKFAQIAEAARDWRGEEPLRY